MKAGENPYRYIAIQLGIEDQMDVLVAQYMNSPRTDTDYQKLIDKEIPLFIEGYKRKNNGCAPIKGDLERMLPNSAVTEDAKKTIPELIEKNHEVVVLVSSGIEILVKQITDVFDIPQENIHANKFLYDEQTGILSGIEVNVSGNKVKALDKAMHNLLERNIMPSDIVYVDDNNWGHDGMQKVINDGGYVFYLRPGLEEDKQYPMNDKSLEENDRFFVIKSLTDIVTHPIVTEKKVWAVIFDADGTVIDTNR